MPPILVHSCRPQCVRIPGWLDSGGEPRFSRGNDHGRRGGRESSRSVRHSLRHQRPPVRAPSGDNLDELRGAAGRGSFRRWSPGDIRSVMVDNCRRINSYCRLDVTDESPLGSRWYSALSWKTRLAYRSMTSDSLIGCFPRGVEMPAPSLRNGHAVRKRGF